MISSINFTGIKNIAYARAYSSNGNDYKKTHTIMNMELTDDFGNKDLAEYKKILKERPNLANEINDRYVNLDLEIANTEGMSLYRLLFNGNLIFPNMSDNKVLSFSRGLVDKIVKLKTKDFKVDPDQHLMKEAQEGLIYKNNIEYYVDGSFGRLDLLEGTGLIEKFDYLLNDKDAKLTEAQEEKLYEAIDNIVGVLHEPIYVHNGAMYMQALLKGYKNPNLPS